MPQRNIIKMFTRNILRCTCPDDVFDKIQCQWRSICSIDVKVFEIRIGGRLLIFLWNTESTSAQKYLESVIQLGRNTRDKDGFNRFRLVITFDFKTDWNKDIDTQFQKLSQNDEKMHLHLIPNQQIPENIFTSQTQ